jgi:hypothetical protein
MAELKEKPIFVQSFDTPELLLDEIEKKYKVSTAKNAEIRKFFAEISKPVEKADDLPF